MIVATKNVTVNLPNGKRIELVKGERVPTGTLKKLTSAQKRDYTTEMALPAQITRRIPGREAALNALGIFSDVNLEVLRSLSDNVDDATLRGLGRNQLGKIAHFEKLVVTKFNLKDRQVVLTGVTDDNAPWTEAKSWKAWPLSQEEAKDVYEFVSQQISESAF